MGKKHPYYGKSMSINFQDFPHTMGFIAFFHTVGNLWRNPRISQMMALVIFFLWSKHFKVKDFLNFWLEADIHAVPKIWEKWISMVQAKYWNTQTFQIYGFLKYFGWSRPPYNYQNMGNMNSHDTRKVWEKTNIPKLWFSQIFWVKQKSIQCPKYGKSESP